MVRPSPLIVGLSSRIVISPANRRDIRSDFANFASQPLSHPRRNICPDADVGSHGRHTPASPLAGRHGGPARPLQPGRGRSTRRRGTAARGGFDLEVVRFPTADREPEDGPAPPEERARELTDAFEDPTVRGVVAATGGDDQLRVLRHLDPERLRANPTRFLGYSDNDDLRLFLLRLGQVSWGVQAHPDVTVDPELHPYREQYLARALFDDALGEVKPAGAWTDEWYRGRCGEAASPSSRGTSGASGSSPNRRPSTTPCSREFDEHRETIRAEVNRELDRYADDATAAFGVDFGHTSPTFPLPLGATATLDPSEGTIRFD
ncbi:LD-carboxypeptidase [Halorarum salinum]|uniref:LD-carboxypeptidase n=1 Tax=Halorarum salinum TaxID=2743089 RepID=UPI001FEAC0F6|nr:LD-carboxypeptidase [Halobaculum salinum]